MNPTDPISFETVAIFAAGITFAVGVVMYVTQRFSSIWRAFDAYRLHVAETYSTKVGQQDSENRILDELRRLGNRIDEMFRNKTRDE